MTEFKRILVPLDGSSLSERALPEATALAQNLGSEIVLLRVLDIPPTPPTPYPEVSIGWERQARACAYRKAQSYLDARQQELYEQGIEVRALMRDQSPAEDILQVVVREGIDLIVMSAHGRGGAGSLDVWRRSRRGCAPQPLPSVARALCCTCGDGGRILVNGRTESLSAHVAGVHVYGKGVHLSREGGRP